MGRLLCPKPWFFNYFQGISNFPGKLEGPQPVILAIPYSPWWAIAYSPTKLPISPWAGPIGRRLILMPGKVGKRTFA